MKGLAALGFCLCLAAGNLGCRSDPPLDVAQVDLDRFQGKWYEVAKLPRPTQLGCENTTAVYDLDADGKMAIVNECERNGALDTRLMKAVVPDSDVPAKLSLEINGFYGDYWILEVGDDYEYAVIGHPSRDYLWILSRTPTLPRSKLDTIVASAGDKLFDVSRLQYTKQSARP